MTSRKQDLISAAGFIAIALLIIFVAIPYGVQEPKKVKFAALSPSYYPRLVGYCLLLFGVILFFKALLISNSTHATTVISTFVRSRLLPVIAVLAALYFALQPFGFVLAPAIALTVLLWLAGERNVFVIALMSVLLPLALYFFFVKVANIPIPGGLLDPLLQKF